MTKPQDEMKRQPNADVKKGILVYSNRGRGIEDDPIRNVIDVYDSEMNYLFTFDPYEKPETTG